MEPIRKQTRMARRRLTSQRFLESLPWALTVALGVALVGLGLPKVVHLDVDPRLWSGGWLAGAAGVALVFSLVRTWLARPSEATAAAEIDRRFALRERLSSALLLADEDRQTNLGRALLTDAQRRAEQLDIRDRFNWGMHRGMLLPALPLLMAAALWLVPDRAAPEVNLAAENLSVTQIKNATQPLVEQLKKKRLAAEEQGLAAAVDMFKKLEAELSKLEKDAKLDTKQSLAKLNDIKQQLEERKQELGSSESLRKNLQNLEKFEAGPADKLAESLKQGDLEQAEQALSQLMEQLKNGQLSPEALEKLQKQMAQLEKSLSQAAEAHEQAKQNLQQQISQAEAAGDMQKAAQLEQKLAELQAQDANMAMMQQLSESLAQAQQAMQQGQLSEASQALSELASQLQEMNEADSQLQDLDQLMDSLSQSKSQMACKQCSGAGCQSCMGSSMVSQFPGMGMSEGQGAGDRPEEEDEVDFFDSQVRDQMRRGETVYGGKVGGDNRKGTSQVEVQEAVLTSLSEEPEPLEDTPLPKLQRDHSRDYFNTFRQGTPDK